MDPRGIKIASNISKGSGTRVGGGGKTSEVEGEEELKKSGEIDD